MKDNSCQLQDEDTLINSIINGTDDDIEALRKKLPECNDFIQEIQSIKSGLQAIEEEEPPAHLMRDIIKKKKKQSIFPFLQNLPLGWDKNPFIMGLGLLAFIIFLYYFIVHVIG